MDKISIIKKMPFWENLTDKEKEIILEQSVITEYEKGRIIHSDKDKCLGMMYIISGEIRTYITSEEGREITLYRLHKDDSCVISASCIITEITFPTQIKAEKDCKIIIISSSILSKINENNIYVRCYMYETLTKRFSSVVKAMEQMLFVNFDKRLATFLLSEKNRTDKTELKMTHEQIAMNINSAREVVTRTLKKFEKENIVTLKRGAIIINDENKLRKIIE